MNTLTGNIIITGGRKGIGAAIAKEWCKRNKENMYFNFSKWNDIDIRRRDSINDFFNSIDESIIKENRNFIIALINNAGVCRLGNILESNLKDFKNIFNVNLFGLFSCSQEYVRFCIKNRIQGKIINIASTAGLGARPGRGIYAASKAAVINYSLTLSEELKQYGIKVYCVCPGAVNTDMRKYISPDDDFEKMLQPNDVGKFCCSLIDNLEMSKLDGQILTLKR
jgi:short-subunit dehydrogenase